MAYLPRRPKRTDPKEHEPYAGLIPVGVELLCELKTCEIKFRKLKRHAKDADPIEMWQILWVVLAGQYKDKTLQDEWWFIPDDPNSTYRIHFILEQLGIDLPFETDKFEIVPKDVINRKCLIMADIKADKSRGRSRRVNKPEYWHGYKRYTEEYGVAKMYEATPLSRLF